MYKHSSQSLWFGFFTFNLCAKKHCLIQICHYLFFMDYLKMHFKNLIYSNHFYKFNISFLLNQEKGENGFKSYDFKCRKLRKEKFSLQKKLGLVEVG